MQPITPFLWLALNADEAANFYVSIFPNSRITSTTRYGDGTPVPKGTIMTVGFELNGLHFVAINGGQAIPYSAAISFVVNCETQAEVDRYWTALSQGGETQRCGWLKDRFGLSWQIVPTALPRLLQQPDPARANRVMQAMLQMDRLDIAQLEAAAR